MPTSLVRLSEHDLADIRLRNFKFPVDDVTALLEELDARDPDDARGAASDADDLIRELKAKIW